MCPSVAVIKTYYNHTDRLWVQVEDPAAGKQLQKTAEFSNPNSPRTALIAKKKLQITQQKREKTNSLRNDRCLKTKIASDKYYNMIFLVHSHNYEYHVLTPVTCKYASGAILMY